MALQQIHCGVQVQNIANFQMNNLKSIISPSSLQPQQQEAPLYNVHNVTNHTYNNSYQNQHTDTTFYINLISLCMQQQQQINTLQSQLNQTQHTILNLEQTNLHLKLELAILEKEHMRLQLIISNLEKERTDEIITNQHEQIKELKQTISHMKYQKLQQYQNRMKYDDTSTTHFN